MAGDRVNNGALEHSKAGLRWPILDFARGLALVAMIVYHFTWDLSFFRYIDPGVATAPAWAWFAKGIAASFLFLSGVSFALAARDGLNRSAFVRRLVMIVAAALAVSFGTAYAMPHAPVLFGILHCLAAASVVLLFAMRLPDWLVIILAIAVFAAPALFSTASLDGPAWAWLGLNITPVMAVDHVPLLPWSGWALLGFALMRMVLRFPALEIGREYLAAWRSKSALGQLLMFGGRHSLAVYLLHQPLLMGLLWLGAPTADAAAGFRTSCVAACRHNSADILYCERYCQCVAQALGARPLWKNVIRNTLTPEEMREAESLAAQCR